MRMHTDKSTTRADGRPSVRPGRGMARVEPTDLQIGCSPVAPLPGQRLVSIELVQVQHAPPCARDATGFNAFGRDTPPFGDVSFRGTRAREERNRNHSINSCDKL